MTFAELAEAITHLTPEQLGKTVEVFPPQSCPASDRVPVTALLLVGGSEGTAGTPVLSTGKKPV